MTHNRMADNDVVYIRQLPNIHLEKSLLSFLTVYA